MFIFISNPLNYVAMRNIVILIVISSLLTNIDKLQAQIIWTGPTITFTKADNVDWTLEENQDRITPNVWITRANTQGIFNIVSETSYTEEFSPADTEWAFGTTIDAGTLEYDPWEETIGTPPEMMNLDMVLHLITDDIFIDIKFTEWTGGGNGGGFTYERSTDPLAGSQEFDLKKKIKVYPNPSSDYIQISNLLTPTKYKIYNILGLKILEGTISENEKLNLISFNDGMYIIHFENGNIIKFIKK
jgi:hypothetical protein